MVDWQDQGDEDESTSGVDADDAGDGDGGDGDDAGVAGGEGCRGGGGGGLGLDVAVRESAVTARVAAGCGTAVEAALSTLKTMFSAGFAAAAEPSMPFEKRRLRVIEVASGFQGVCVSIVPDNLAPLREEMRQWLVAETLRVLGAEAKVDAFKHAT